MTDFVVRNLSALSLTLSIVIAIPSTFGAVINEAETDGSAINNSLATAQNISASAFTTPVPGTVFNPPGYVTATVQGSGGFNDVDFFRFFSFGAGRVYLDMDNPVPAFDPMLALFDSAGTLLAFGDDSELDNGSVNTIDPFLGVFHLPGAGEYFVAVSENPNFPTVALTGSVTQLNRPDGLPGGSAVSGVPSGISTFDFNGVQPGGGSYTLNISAQTAVPEPGSFVLLGCGLTALSSFVRRRKTS